MLSSAELELEGAQCRGERAIGPLWLRVQGRRFGVVFFEAGFGVRASIFSRWGGWVGKLEVVVGS